MKKYLNWKKIKEHFLEIAITLFLAGQLVFFSIFTRKGLPPDENYHLAVIHIYEDNLLPFLRYQIGDFWLGDLTRYTNLYHYILSKLGMLNMFGIDELLFLRLVNVVIVLIGFYFLYKAISVIEKKKEVILLTLFLLSNTLMFLFLSASVNYDNMLFCLNMMSLYYFFLSLKKVGATNLVKLLVVNMLASLVKFTFLPIFFLQAIILIITHIKKQDFKKKFSISLPNKLSSYLLVIILVITSFLFFEKYVGNMFVYKSLLPGCDSIHSVKECSNSAVYRRNTSLTANPFEKEYNFIEFSYQWLKRMETGTYGIISHVAIPRGRYFFVGLNVIFLLGLISFVIKIKTINTYEKALVAIIILYCGIVFLGVNYKDYLKMGVFGLGIQGRYLFPILPMAYYLLSKYIFNLTDHKYIKPILITFVSLYFLYNSVIWFLLFGNPSLLR